MARRSRHNPPPPPYQEAEAKINLMERAVIYRSVTLDFTPQDLLDTLLPADVRRKLRDACGLTKSASGAWDIDLQLHDHPMHLQFACRELATLTPNDQNMDVWNDWKGWPETTLKTPLIASTLLEICQIVTDFNVVRTVVEWLNEEKVSPGCARHYLPGLGSLLPAHHPFHQVSGERFKDNYFSSEIANAIRRTPEVIAKGLLCDPDNHGNKTGRQTVIFHYGRDYYQNIPLFTTGP